MTRKSIEASDLLDRLEELLDEHGNLKYAIDEWHAATEEERLAMPSLDELQKDLDSWEQENLAEMQALEEVEGEIDRHSCLIHEDDFTSHVRELVEETNDLDNLPNYIRYNINWDGVVDDFRHDYTVIEYAGETYYVQS